MRKDFHLRLNIVLIACAFLSLTAYAADFSGKWKIEGDIQGNPVNLDCSVQQPNAEDKIAGSCTINSGESVDISGAVKGEKVNFSFTAGGYTLTFMGTLDSETMKGDIEVAGTTGTFTGKRAK
jgi:hypothetical protein